MLFLEFLNPGEPGGAVRLFELLHKCLEDHLHVAHQGNVHVDDLADLGRVDVDVDDRGLRRKGVDVHGDAVVKARSESDQQIAFGDGEVGVTRPVQAEHAEKERVLAGEAGQSHKGVRHRGGNGLGQLEQFLRRIGGNDSAPA